jgi:hypothetical protein
MQRLRMSGKAGSKQVDKYQAFSTAVQQIIE